MKLIDRILAQRTGKRFPDYFGGPSTYISVIKGEPITPQGFSHLYEYRVGFTLEVVTRCNEVEYDSMFQNALSQIMETVYNDVVASAREAINAVQAGDRNAALLALNEIIKLTKV